MEVTRFSGSTEQRCGKDFERKAELRERPATCVTTQVALVAASVARPAALGLCGRCWPGRSQSVGDR